MNKWLSVAHAHRGIEIFQYLGGGFSLLMAMVGFPLVTEFEMMGLSAMMLVMALLFLWGGIALIRMARKGARLRKLVTVYAPILDQNPSMIHLSAALGVAEEVVQENLQQMIIRNYFGPAYLDMKSHCLVCVTGKRMEEPPAVSVSPHKPQSQSAVVCKGCGGVNHGEHRALSECEYCGAPLNRQ